MKRIGQIVHRSVVLLALCVLGLAATVAAQTFTTTTVQGTVYGASGAPVSGTLQITWPAFTTAAGQAVAADRTTVTIGADGFFSVNLAPNIGAMPAGLYYTAIYHLSDGTTSTEYWQVPAATTATLSQVRATVMPAAQAVQAVSKAYVDQSVAEALQGQVTVTGGTLTSPLYLSGDPSQPTQAADKHYVDDSVAGTLPLNGGVLTGPVTGPQIGAVYQADQFAGADFGAKLQACISGLSASYGGTCDARNFAGAVTMAANLTVSVANATIDLPCSTITTAASIVIPAGVRNVTLHGCASEGTSAASGSQGGTVILYSGTGSAIKVGDSTYAADTPGFHLDNVVVNTTGATASTARAITVWRTQELTISGLYLLGNANQTAITLDGTGNYTGGSIDDTHISGFQTAVNAIGHQVANPATTDWVNASTFVRLHIDCPTTSGNPIAGTFGINLQQGDGNTFTGGDVEGCATALHLGANAQNNTLMGLRNENSSYQVVADAGSNYNSWITGGTMYTGKLTDSGTHNSFLDTFHRSFNGLNGDLYRSQADATVTNHIYLGIGLGNVRGRQDEYITDVPGQAGSYQNAWLWGPQDGASGQQTWALQDMLNNVPRFGVQQNTAVGGSPQTYLNAAGGGSVCFNCSANAGTGGVNFSSGGSLPATVATIDQQGDAQFNGTLQVSGTSQSAGTLTVRNNADAEVDYYLWPGLTASQKGSFTYKDFNGNSQWYLVKDASNNWALNSAVGGLDSFKAYQSSNSGDTYVNASNAAGHIRLNYETGAGAETDIYTSGSANLAAAFLSPTSIKLPGLAAASGHNCVQIDNSGYLTNTGSACGSGGGSGTVNTGTAGEIAYYSASGTAVSGTSAVPVSSGGTGATTAAAALGNLLPGVTTYSSNGMAVAGNTKVSGSLTATSTVGFSTLAAASGHNCVQVDTSGNLTNTGVACGSGGTNGTVNSGSSGQIAYYSANGTVVSGTTTVSASVNGVFNITAYGAVGDCTGTGGTTSCTDNSTAIQNAVNAAFAVGGAVYFPANPGNTNSQTVYYAGYPIDFKGVSMYGPPGAAGLPHGGASYINVAVRGGQGLDVFHSLDPTEAGFVAPLQSPVIRDLGVIVDNSLDVTSTAAGTGGARTCNDGAMSNSSATLTSASQCSFQSTDVGQRIVVYGAGSGGSNLTTTILSRQSATQVTLSSAASAAVSGVTTYIYSFANRLPGRTCWDGAMTNASTVLTSSAQCEFQPGDVGQAVVVYGAGSSGNLVTTISTYTSPTSVTLSSPAGATVTGAHAYISLMGLPTTQSAGNCGFAEDDMSGERSPIANFNGVLENVVIQTTSGGPGNNTCGYFFQGNAAPYYGLWKKGAITGTFGWLFVPATNVAPSASVSDGIEDFNTFEQMYLWTSYPFVSYDGLFTTFRDVQIGAAASGIQLLDGYGLETFTWQDYIDVPETESLGSCPLGVGLRLAGTSHTVERYELLNCSTLQLDASNSFVRQLMVADNTASSTINIAGSDNEIQVPFYPNNTTGPTFNITGTGNQWITGQSSSPYKGLQPARKQYVGNGINGASTNIPALSRQAIAFNHTHDFLDKGGSNYYLNGEDLWMWPQELLGSPGLVNPSVTTGDAVAATAETGSYFQILASGSQSLNGTDGSLWILGQSLPAGPTRWYFRAETTSSTSNLTFTVQSGTYTGGYTTYAACTITGINATWGIYHCDADATGLVNNVRIYMSNPSNPVDVDWVAAVPWGTDAIEESLTLGTPAAPGAPMTTSAGNGGVAQETTSAAKTSGHLASYDANGDVIDSGSAGAPPAGTASGDLSGSYPGPTVAKVNGGSVPASANGLATNSGSQPVAQTAHNQSAIDSCAASNAGNTYSCSTSPSFTPAAGDQVNVDFNAANTGSATLNVNGAGAKALYKWGNTTTLASGDIQAGHYIRATYDGSHWQLEGQLGNANATQVNGAAAPVSATIVGTNGSGQLVSASSATLGNATTGNAATATSIAGQTTDCALYQSAAGTTACASAPTTANTLQVLAAQPNGSAAAPAFVNATALMWSPGTQYYAQSSLVFVQNDLTYIAFTLPQAIYTSHVQVTPYTADNTTNKYDIGIYSISGSTATLAAHIGATAGTTFAPSTSQSNLAWTSPVLLMPGTYLWVETTNCASSCAALRAASVGASTGTIYLSLGSGSTTGGALPGSITGLSVTATAGFLPNFMLY